MMIPRTRIARATLGSQRGIGRRSRGYLATSVCTVVIAAMLGVNAPSASANTSHVYEGVVYGLNNESGSVYSYYWALASYATMASDGAPKVASLVCGAVFDEPWAGKACYY